jgi:hypothetical protein
MASNVDAAERLSNHRTGVLVTGLAFIMPSVSLEILQPNRISERKARCINGNSCDSGMAAR